jgi:hypothetical protein
MFVSLAGPSDARGDALIAGLAFGIAVAVVASWRLSHPLENLWQRAVVSVLAVFGALILAFLLTIPARQLMGLAGLIVLAALLLGTGIAAARWAVRGRGAPPAEAIGETGK